MKETKFGPEKQTYGQQIYGIALGLKEFIKKHNIETAGGVTKFFNDGIHISYKYHYILLPEYNEYQLEAIQIALPTTVEKTHITRHRHALDEIKDIPLSKTTINEISNNAPLEIKLIKEKGYISHAGENVPMVVDKNGFVQKESNCYHYGISILTERGEFFNKLTEMAKPILSRK